MPSKIMTISIPESMHRHVQNRVSGDAYGSVSEYFRELIRHDQRITQRALQQAAIERQAAVGLSRAPSHRPIRWAKVLRSDVYGFRAKEPSHYRSRF